MCIIIRLSNSDCLYVLFTDDFRIFCGDIGNEVTDELLTKVFCKYPSFLKAKVSCHVLDKL